MKNPIKYVSKLECVVKLFDLPSKIFKGHRVIVHSHFAKISGKMSKFEELLDSETLQLLKKRPAALSSN